MKLLPTHGPYTVLGLMSGSSLDGLDACVAEFTEQAPSQWQWRVLTAETLPYPPEWRERLQQLPLANAVELAKAHADFGHILGMWARRLLVEHGLLEQVQAVSSHGHTVFHQPQRQFTFQLGCGQTLATHLGVPVVTDFRTADIALGGEGAPLVPFAERHLFPDHELFLNLGGIANISLLPRAEADAQRWQQATWLRKPARFVGFDVCGCNQLLNAASGRSSPPLAYDANGQLARSGSLIPELLSELLQQPYHQLPPPKSLGNEDVRGSWQMVLAEYAARVPADLLRTLVEYVALAVAQELTRLSPSCGLLLITGGGAHNGFLVERLQKALQPLGIVPEVPAAQIVDQKEALAFAFLGLNTLLGRPNTLPDATGARRAVCAGGIHRP